MMNAQPKIDANTKAVVEGPMTDGSFIIGLEATRSFRMPSGEGVVLWLKSRAEAYALYEALSEALTVSTQAPEK